MTTYEITSSTELMENYVQASVMAPQQAFRAAEGPGGRALLFSIGSEDSGSPFNVTVELTGQRHGWHTVGLGGGAGQHPCQLFAVGPAADSIHLAMALRDGSNDTLHLGRLTVGADGDIPTPTWTAYPYDDPTLPRSRVEIAGLFLSQATDGEYVVVDVLRDPDSPARHLTRYYVDPAKADGHAWHLHDVAIDLDPVGYVSALGRRDAEDIDGLYVGGQIDGHPQLVYAPLAVVDGRPGQRPKPSYLQLTAADDQVPEAITTSPNGDDTTDLYVAAHGTLYRFASTNQHHESVAVAVATSPLLTSVRDLFAFRDEHRVVVWGRNADNLAFYLACPHDQLDRPGAWSLPLPLLSGVQHVSPYVNRGSRPDTIFAHTHDNQLKVGLKSSTTLAWSWSDITLPLADTKVPARKISSYTTRIQVFDDQRSPATLATVALTAQNPTTVQINHLYYAVGPTPVHVPVDPTGTVTVIESVPRLTGTQFGVAVESAPTKAINPMDKAFRKATDLQSVQKLRDAEIVRYVDGVRQPARKLISASVDDAALQRVAHLNEQCAHVYQNPLQGPTPRLQAAMDAVDPPFHVPDGTPVVDGGDLFQFLETVSTDQQLRSRLTRTAGVPVGAETAAGGEAAVGETFWEMLVRWFEGAWEFVVKIGEAIYRCILKVIEDVVAAVRWAFDKIVTAIEDFIHFLSFLFEWDDFKRTKNVIKNVSTAFIKHEIAQLPVIRQKFDQLIDDTVKIVDDWAGVLPDVSGLGPTAGSRPSNQSSTDHPDAAGSMLSHHFQGNVDNASHQQGLPDAPPTSLFEVLFQAYEQEKKTLGAASDRLEHLFQVAATMSVGDILKQLVDIVVDTTLRSAQVVVDALLDFLHLVAIKVFEFLDTPIHFPILSDILNAIGIPDFSMLDLVCWVVAVPVTIIYKIGTAVAGDARAPFPDDAETTFLSETTDFAAIVAAFSHPSSVGSAEDVVAGTLVGDGPIAMSPRAAKATFICLHMSAATCGFVSAFLDAFESATLTKEVTLSMTAGTVASAFIGGVSRGVANVLVPQDPVTDGLAIYYSRYFLAAFVLNKCIHGLMGFLQQENDPTDYRKRGAIVDAVLVIPAAAITIVHFVELGHKDADTTRSIAILDEVSYVATYIARILYTVVVTDVVEDPESKALVVVGMAVSQLVHGGIQWGESIVGANFMPNT